MQAIRLERHGPTSVFELRDLAAPEPAAGQLRIRVDAAGVNFADILARQGIYPDCPPLPCTLGYEAVGTVDAVGEGVDAAWLGRRVMALTDFDAYAEQVCVGADYAWPVPGALSGEEAAAIPLNYLTAWALLIAMGSLKAGETVLIHNAGGGVGLAALDIARHVGARVIGTASMAKHGRLDARGCDEVIDYTLSDWQSAVLDITNGRGVDLAIDPIGGTHWNWTREVLAPAGRMGMYGISSASAPGAIGKLKLLKLFLGAPIFHPARLIPGNQGVFGVNIHAMYEESGLFRDWMKEILAGVEQGWVRPHVDRVFGFAEVSQAHAWIEGRRNFGKVVLVPRAPGA